MDEEIEELLARAGIKEVCSKCGDTGYWFNGQHFEKCNCK